MLLSCSEKLIEPSSGLLVCPISGAVSDRMMTCAEEEAEEGPREGDGGGNGLADEEYGGKKGEMGMPCVAGLLNSPGPGSAVHCFTSGHVGTVSQGILQ